MSLSMNERAAALVDAMVADADALGIEVRTLTPGARLVDCGARPAAGCRPGLGFAAACMGGLGRIDPVPVAVGDRTWPGVGGRGRRAGGRLPGRAVRRLEARAR